MVAISIHAPVKGATVGSILFPAIDPISIHAPVKGATSFCQTLKRDRGYFNPRTREGCDTPVGHARPDCGISIHAPVKGATCGRMKTHGDRGVFQSTHP